MAMCICDQIACRLKAYGVRDFFGYQGGTVSHLIDAFVRKGLNFHQCKTEQASGFAADAYARVSGELGVVVACGGPGVANLVASIANAFYDSVPCLFILGQIPSLERTTGMTRQRGFQEMPAIKVVEPICKCVYSLRVSDNVYKVLDRMVASAIGGRAGPVCLEIPIDVLIANSTLVTSVLGESFVGVRRKTISVDLREEIEKLSDAIRVAKRPVVVVGGGVHHAQAQDDLLHFIQLNMIPCVKTLHGLDVVPSSQSEFSGVYGSAKANWMIRNSDLLIIMGSSLARQQFCVSKLVDMEECKVFHIDVAIDEMCNHIVGSTFIQCDLKVLLQQLNEAGRLVCDAIWDSNVHLDVFESRPNLTITPECYKACTAISALSRIFPEGGMVTLDVGLNQMWCAKSWMVKRCQRIISSGGLGCMGYAIPAAIGIAYVKHPVWAFCGDGGFQMGLQELDTIVNEHLPIAVFVLNNRSLGMVREAQKRHLDSRFYGTVEGYSVPSIEKLANAFGIDYYKFDVTHVDKFASVPLPMIVEIDITETESNENQNA